MRLAGPATGGTQGAGSDWCGLRHMSTRPEAGSLHSLTLSWRSLVALLLAVAWLGNTGARNGGLRCRAACFHAWLGSAWLLALNRSLKKYPPLRLRLPQPDREKDSQTRTQQTRLSALIFPQPHLARLQLGNYLPLRTTPRPDSRYPLPFSHCTAARLVPPADLIELPLATGASLIRGSALRVARCPGPKQEVHQSPLLLQATSNSHAPLALHRSPLSTSQLPIPPNLNPPNPPTPSNF